MENKQYTFFWLSGQREVLEGQDQADALNKAGYGAGALRALDFYDEGDNSDYVWNATTRSWDMTPEARNKFNKKHGITS